MTDSQDGHDKQINEFQLKLSQSTDTISTLRKELSAATEKINSLENTMNARPTAAATSINVNQELVASQAEEIQRLKQHSAKQAEQLQHKEKYVKIVNDIRIGNLECHQRDLKSEGCDMKIDYKLIETKNRWVHGANFELDRHLAVGEDGSKLRNYSLIRSVYGVDPYNTTISGVCKDIIDMSANAVLYRWPRYIRYITRAERRRVREAFAHAAEVRRRISNGAKEDLEQALKGIVEAMTPVVEKLQKLYLIDNKRRASSR